MTRNDLVFVSEDCWVDIWTCKHQPLTEDISKQKAAKDRYVIQLIGDQFNVYDLKTLARNMVGVSIGVPKFVTDDYDAAVMWALMEVGR